VRLPTVRHETVTPRTCYGWRARARTRRSRAASETGLTNAWSSNDTVDRKRLAAEQEACKLMLAEAAKTWSGIVAEHAQ
jgi:hypothetical protein